MALPQRVDSWVRARRHWARPVHHLVGNARSLAAHTPIALHGADRYPRAKRPIALHEASDIRALSAHETYTVPAPRVLPEDGCWMLEPFDAEAAGEWMASLPNARVWGLGAGAVITEHNELVTELSKDHLPISAHAAFMPRGLPRLDVLGGTALMLGTSQAERNFYHWTLDLLPRLRHVDLPSVDWLLVNHRSLPFQLDSLRELGVCPEQVVQLDPQKHVQVDRLLVPSPRRGDAVRTDQIESLRRLPVAPQQTPKRIYISRGKAAFRRLLNEEQLLPVLAEFGFTVVTLEGMPLAVQRALFAGAEVVLGLHGAAFAHLAHCRPGTEFIEILHPSYAYRCFGHIAARAGLRHSVILAEGAIPPRGKHPMARQADARLSPNKLRGALRSWLGP